MEQIKEYEYVDLGLPSGLKWAKCNVGAETETDFGDYFMWGSTTPNTDTPCNWKNAPFNNGSSEYNEEYFNTHISEWLNEDSGEYLTLKPEFDAATQIMGGDWRMPTQDEFQELIDNTTKEWTQVNGVNGYKFTSKKEGYQNNSIFIPAAGSCGDGSVDSVGSYGSVWSSSLYASDHGNAWSLDFDSGYCHMSGSYRGYGLSVRGVRK